MLSAVSRLALFLFFSLLFCSGSLAQEFPLSQKDVKNISIGASVRVFQTRLVEYKVFNFIDGPNSANSKNYNLDINYELGNRLFLTGGIGVTELSRNIRGLKKFEYTEQGNISASANQIFQPYQLTFDSDFHKHEIAFKLRTEKVGDLLDMEEGDPLYLKLYDRFDFYYLSAPITLNYKILSGKNISLFGGIGTQLHLRLADADKQTGRRKRYLSLSYAEEINYTHPFHEWVSRNHVDDIELSYQNQTDDFLIDLILKLGVLREIRRNTFTLNVVYNRTLNGFLGNENLEGLGLQMGWWVKVF